MTAKYDIEYLEEGDVFEGSPIEQSYFISEVLAAGGRVTIDGDHVHIVSLPKKEVPKAKAPVSVPVVEEAPKVEAPKVEARKVEVPKVEAPKPPIKTGPTKPKVALTPLAETDKEEE